MLSLTVWAWRYRKAAGRKRLTESVNELITRLFIEQQLASPGSAKKVRITFNKNNTTEKRNYFVFGRVV